MSPSSVPKFRPIGIRICVLRRILQSVQNEEEIKMKFCLLVSQKWLEQFS